MALRFVCLLISVGSVYGTFLEVILEDSVEFQPTAPCKEGENAQLLHTAHSQPVASLEAGSWKPGPLYTDRLNQSASLILRRVNVKDGGKYEFTCNGELELANIIELRVIIPHVLSVFDGDDAKLPCHSDTAEKPPLWQKDGMLLPVFEMNDSGNKSSGRGWGGSRVSVADDWQRRGDMSLTIKNVTVSDGGLFLCKSSGPTVAVRLEVRGRPPPAPLTTPPPAPSACPQWTGTASALLACVFLGVGIFLGWKLKSRKRQQREPGGGGEPMEVINSHPRGEGLHHSSSVNEQRRAEETRESDNDPQSSQPLVSNGHTVTL
ncbi:uncharacterized protein PAE49_021796 [Odontesthes bonariensis]